MSLYDSISIYGAVFAPPLFLSLIFFFSNLKSIFKPENQIVVDYFFDQYDSGFLLIGLNLCALLFVVPVMLFLPVYTFNYGVDWLFGGLVGCLLAQIFAYKCHYPSIHYLSKSTFNLYHYLHKRYDGSKVLCYVSCSIHTAILFVFGALILMLTANWTSLLANFIDRKILITLIAAAAAIPVIVRGQKGAALITCFTFSIFLLVYIASVIFTLIMTGAKIPASSIFVPNWKTWRFDRPNIFYAGIASFIFYLSIFNSNQLSYQNFCSVGSAKKLRRIFWLILILSIICWAPGSILALTLKTGDDRDRNLRALELLPDYMKILTRDRQQGLWLIFMIITLSFIVLLIYISILPNILISLSSVVWEDIFGGRFLRTSPRISAMLIRCIVLVFTTLISIAACTFSHFYDTFIFANMENLLIFLASLSTPNGALFFTAVCLPCTNFWGAIFGSASGWATSMIFGSNVIDWRTSAHLTSNETLINSNSTLILNQRCLDSNNNIKCLSYEWLIILPFFVTVVVCLVVSLITGGQDLYDLDWNLIRFRCPNVVEKWTCGRNCGPKNKKRRKSFNLYETALVGGRPTTGRSKFTSKNKKRSNSATGSAYSPCVSRQQSLEPFSDTNYHNPNVKSYFDSLSRR
uniref:Uncharacterized protein n=1 Tax=Romanomermis culicivorax TaxID=13658 RepID=A0A915I486_ROMCU